jgi:hypothetical protein
MASMILRIIPFNENILQLLLRDLNNQACELAQSRESVTVFYFAGYSAWMKAG